MEIRDLRFFCLTAEMEHVTKAAEKLGVAQPFLTKVISQMEKEVGVPLFDNVGRKIKLNRYGEVLYSHAKKILVELDNLRDDMDNLIDRQSRTIRILMNTEFNYSDLFIEYKQLHPNVLLSTAFATREDIANALRIGEADFGVCSPPLNDDAAKNIKTDVVFEEHACALLPPGHPLLSKESLTFEDMEGMNLITTTRNSALRINLQPFLDKYNYNPNIIFESNDFNLIIKAVMSGMGYAFIPRSLFFSNPDIREYCVASSYNDTLGEIGISHSTVQNDVNAESDFVEFVKDFFRRKLSIYFNDI